ncbi:type II secretion system inner membrane protein GspF [Desulfonema magnum]|uniref:General secretion pathway protein F n=1 Tax=Desulfonema magnum TaxID=45655 RepID=A0A975BWZ0_9BACT|nr:type II secretion system inner membrane protein GspF [Desulfonema magnum]QTA93218.1 General secretion pathway protein F [Desulfonema magnum]
MPVYEYNALDMKGKTVSGIIDAESSSAARQKLRSSRIFPVSIKEAYKTSAKKESGFLQKTRFLSLSRVKPSEVAMMTRQLATLVGAGFPLVSGIDTLIPQTKSQVFKKDLAQIKDSIVEGNSFAASLSMYPGIFSQLYINMVSAGESSGTLEIVLDRLADITEKQQALKSRIRSALAYPVLMSFIGAAVLFFLLTFIVPTISSIFEDMNRVLPASTQFLITTSHIFKSYWWGIFILMAGIVIVIRSMRKTKKGRHFLDKIILSLPGIGGLSKKLAVARFSRTLGSLLENGVSMLSALDIVKNIVGNVLLSDAIAEASQEVGKGQGLGMSLSKGDVFPSLSIQMIQVGEQSGQLESMLNKIADVYEREVESTVMSMTSLLEPIMILLMGMVTGFIVLSICLPIFEMNQLVR